MKGMIRSAAALGLVAIAGTSLLTGVDFLTADRIAAQEKRVILEQLGQIIPQQYDNQLLDDRFSFRNEYGSFTKSPISDFNCNYLYYRNNVYYVVGRTNY